MGEAAVQADVRVATMCPGRMCKWFCLLCLCSIPAFAEGRWLRLQSEHFEVLTDAGASSGREVLRRFEQIRHLFESRTGRGDLTPLPVRVFVFRNEDEFRAYQVNAIAAGYYQPGSDRDYIAMQLSGADTYRVVYHEYTHLLLRHAGFRVPVWFNEGTAELFSTAEVGKVEIRVGDLVPAHVVTLRGQRMLDLATLTSVDHDSPYYNERGKSGIFYAQSWALIHMLNFAPEYRPGVGNFMQMIFAGEDPMRSFRQAFGKAPGVVIQDLKAYLQSARFQGVRFRTTKFDEEKVPAEAMTDLAARLALVDLQLAIGNVDEARLMYGKLQAGYPDDDAVLLALGQFSLRMQDYAGARGFFERSIAAGCETAQLFFDYAMTLREMGEPEALVLQNLLRAVAADDRFFEAHSFLGYLYLRDDRFPEAIRHLKRSTELQSRRVSVWENLALAYHKSGLKVEARTAAKSARRVASSPEEATRVDALLDLIESDADKIVEAPSRRGEDPRAAGPPISRAQGMLTQVDCIGPRARLHIAIDRGKVLLLVNDPSAVLLRGSDVLRTQLQCGPIASRPVLVEYTPEAHRTYGTAGVVTIIEFR